MSKQIVSIPAQLRTVTGRKVKSIRQQGLTPASIYGHEFKPLSVQFDSALLQSTFSHAGESTLVEVVIGEDKYPILFKNPQYHPLTSALLHVDCHKVNLKEKIVATVPIEFVGESLAVKNGNVLVPILDEIEVEALPTDLPEKFIVDISSLVDVDQMIIVADLQNDSAKVEIKTDLTSAIVKTEAPKVEEEPITPEAEVTPGDVPATEQKTEEEKTADDEAKKAEKVEDKGQKEEK
ncbi:50S ribosomal protein L25 [Candidatus Shapirobacteria bacterium CG_4_10_14_0_2_um_filter_40_12]|uniref:Large ribosomal subunit protein bL25 n=1 Tax=Candidatus Shapirobacteria bacterium CG_4_10_14_0_2_um_filter_40_12 TaxID=1974871 RepID=A0A2M7TTQ3_9BACT|nr:MAG: 50S ribosomal protein L25 [Candidatus Shapirobacteria bacterium CG_4_10_14_0_2_um_filter_40_12]